MRFALTIAFLTILLCHKLVFAQQDPLYSQYHFNQQVINPAYPGIHNNTNISLISRWQWVGNFKGNNVDGNPLTNSLTASTSLVQDKLGLGVMFVQDALGVASNFEAHFSAAYKISWADKVFAFGLQGGMLSVNYNLTKLTLYDPGDPAFQGGSIRAVKPNFGAGVALMSDNMYIGLSVPRLLATEFADGVTSSLRYQRHYYATAAYLLPINSVMKLRPSVLLRYVEGAPSNTLSYDINALLMINNDIWAGAYTRNFKTIGLMFQIDFGDAYRFGYNLELPAVEGLTKFTTHEFLLSIDLGLFGQQDVYQRYF